MYVRCPPSGKDSLALVRSSGSQPWAKTKRSEGHGSREPAVRGKQSRLVCAGRRTTIHRPGNTAQRTPPAAGRVAPGEVESAESGSASGRTKTSKKGAVCKLARREANSIPCCASITDQSLRELDQCVEAETASVCPAISVRRGKKRNAPNLNLGHSHAAGETVLCAGRLVKVMMTTTACNWNGRVW